ncbi:DUF294 nucleotidyltransferase-like domain-containing protein [Paenibacillus sp. TRM 82003]|nr:DUF294 nucleotidyltransferase-like domain-containing protein [Paenibacillus sp. TRM 82003]
MREWNEVKRMIEGSSDLERLRALRDEVHEAFDAASSLERDPVELINGLHDAFIRKTLAIAEERVRATETVAPPVSSFAVVLFGSGGRREQTLWSDQDNGIVYEPCGDADPEAAADYMGRLGDAFRSSLEAVGYPPCEGNVLVSNPLWCRTLLDWKRTVRGWIEAPEFETVRYTLIAADGRAIYGDEALVASLRGELIRSIAEHPAILPRMLQNTLRYKVLVGLLGNLLTEPYGEDAGGIDVKYGAYIPMVNAIRLLSLQHGIEATSTLERIEALRVRHVYKPEVLSDWASAFRVVLAFRSMTPYQLEDGKYTAKGILPAHQLTKDVKRELKQALRVGAELQRLVKRKYGTEGHL